MSDTRDNSESAASVRIDQGEERTRTAEAQAVRAEVEAQDIGNLAGADKEIEVVYRWLKHRNAMVSERERLKIEMQKQIARINNDIASDDFVYGPEVREVVSRRLKGKRARSIQTPYGKVGFRRAPDRLEVLNPDELREFARMFIDGGIVESVNMPAVRKAWKEGGDVPAGCRANEGGDVFYPNEKLLLENEDE